MKLVTWAQRSSEMDEDKNIVYLSVIAVDLQHPKVELTAEGVTVEGVQRETNNVYKVSFEFYEPIDAEVTIPDPLQLPFTSLAAAFCCECFELWRD
jgi:hypothetical protein